MNTERKTTVSETIVIRASNAKVIIKTKNNAVEDVTFEWFSKNSNSSGWYPHEVQDYRAALPDLRDVITEALNVIDGLKKT